MKRKTRVKKKKEGTKRMKRLESLGQEHGSKLLWGQTPSQEKKNRHAGFEKKTSRASLGARGIAK